MKKRICLFAIMLSIYSQIASALDITIAGKPYPAFLFIPLALILFVWLAVMFKWLFKHFSRIALFFYNIAKFVSAFGFRMGITRLKEKIKQKPLVEEVEVNVSSKEIPKEEATKDLTPFIEKINALERKLEHSKEPDAIFKELTPLIKDFFKALLNIHYEFTDDEMVDVLEKKKKHLVEFANKISELKYSGKKLSAKEIHELVKEFKAIVHKYVETGWKPKRIAKGVVERLAEQDKKIFDNVKQYVGFLGGESRKMQIESLLDDEQEILKRNIGSMKRTYNRILRMYVQLSPNEKAVIYPQLIEFYKNANKAIFSSVYGEKSRKELEYFVKELQRLKEMPKMQPWVAKIRMFFSHSIDKSEKLSRKEEKKELVAPKPEVKIKGKKIEAKSELLSMKPLFEKLTRIFRPEEMPEKKARKMLEQKEPKLKEPSFKPFIEKLQEFKDSAKRLFSRIPTKSMKVEKLVVPKAPVEKTNAIEQIGKMLEETPAIEQVDYMKKVENNISKAWNLIAVADFKAFESLYEKIKLDYVNLGENEKQVMDQRLITLLDAETKAKGSIEARNKEDEIKQAEEQRLRWIEEERAKAEQKGRKAEEVLQTGIKNRERETAQKEAREMVSEIQHELNEEQEIAREEELLLKLEAERKEKERQAGVAKDQKDLRKVLKKVDEGFKEKDEIDKEEEELLSWWQKRKLRKERSKAQKVKENLEKQHQEKEELEKEEEELLSWAERRKRNKERREAERVRAELEKQYHEQEELNKEEELLLRLEQERKEKEAKAYTLKEKSKIRAELRQIDILFKERKKLELEALQRERKAEAQKKRIETLEKKKQQQVLTPELTRIDSIFKQKQQEEIQEQRKREWEEQARREEERKKTKLEEIAEVRLKRDIEDQIKRDKLIRQREAEALKREEERRRIELDKRRHVSDRLRIEKEKEWKSSVHGKSLDSLEELQNQLRSVIVNLERKPTVPSEGIKDRLERESEVVRREVEAKRASDLKRITTKEEIKKKKKALSPLEEEQLKLILELERISKGL